jgi:hypothetical protein
MAPPDIVLRIKFAVRLWSKRPFVLAQQVSLTCTLHHGDASLTLRSRNDPSSAKLHLAMHQPHKPTQHLNA